MKESKAITILIIIFLILGLIALYFSLFSTDFNFYKSELEINELEINEKLFFKPDKDYHTLYRNFDVYNTLITISPDKIPNGVSILNLNCQAGTSYVRTYYQKNYANYCYTFNPIKAISCLPYTQPNEYGCTFGYETGFKKGKDYEISSTYTLNPKNLFKINYKYYIKFVAYSKDRHKTLIKGKNLIINDNAITKTIYLQIDDVIIYIPYTKGDIENYNIIYQSDFLFDTNYLKKIFIIFLALFPAISLLISWHLHGKEHSYLDIPPELSNYPKERRAWEVAAYFHPPFSTIDKEFFSAILIDLYRRKLIDLKQKEKNIYLKINENPPRFVNKIKYPDPDGIESELISILKSVKEKSPKKYLDGEYINLKALNSFSTKLSIRNKLEALQKKVKKIGKTYIQDKGAIITNILLVSFLILAYILNISYVMFLYLVTFFILTIIYKRSALLIKFKENYYHEYQQWQAFRKFLSHSYSIKNMPHKAVILWEQYLTYACALGVAKKVLKELKQANIITTEEYALYATSINTSSNYFASASGASGGGGGFGGAGGGGIGGGGGGGR